MIPEGPPFPQALAYLWNWFTEHSAGLAVSGMGPSVITWEGLHAWSTAFLGMQLRYWEALALVRLGRMRASIESEAMAERVKNKGKRPKAK